MSSKPEATVFKYVKEEPKRSKGMQLLCRTDRVVAAVQVVKAGGETNLHSHSLLDGVWFVLKGRAKFYTMDDELVADLGPYEGILVPRDYPYWFERGDGPDDLEILQVEASSKPVATMEEFIQDRTDYTPRKSAVSDAEVTETWEAKS